MNIVPTAGVIIIENGKMLLVKHGESAMHLTDIYGWPGGRIDDGESAREAAVRELKEETGLIAKEEALEEFIHDIPPAKITRKNGEIAIFSVELFVCTNYEGTLQGSDETTPEWVEISKLDEYALLPNVKHVAEILSKIV